MFIGKKNSFASTELLEVTVLVSRGCFRVESLSVVWFDIDEVFVAAETCDRSEYINYSRHGFQRSVFNSNNLRLFSMIHILYKLLTMLNDRGRWKLQVEDEKNTVDSISENFENACRFEYATVSCERLVWKKKLWEDREIFFEYAHSLNESSTHRSDARGSAMMPAAGGSIRVRPWWFRFMYPSCVHPWIFL